MIVFSIRGRRVGIQLGYYKYFKLIFSKTVFFSEFFRRKIRVLLRWNAKDYSGMLYPIL